MSQEGKKIKRRELRIGLADYISISPEVLYQTYGG